VQDVFLGNVNAVLSGSAAAWVASMSISVRF